MNEMGQNTFTQASGFCKIPCWQWWSPWSPCGCRSVSGSLLQEYFLQERRHRLNMDLNILKVFKKSIFCCDSTADNEQMCILYRLWHHLLRSHTRLPAGPFHSSVPPLSAVKHGKQNVQAMYINSFHTKRRSLKAPEPLTLNYGVIHTYS